MPGKSQTTPLDVYMYRYTCARLWGWGGTSDGVQFMQVASNTSPHTAAQQEARRLGSGCDVALLQRFRVLFEAVETYAPITMFPMSVERLRGRHCWKMCQWLCVWPPA